MKYFVFHGCSNTAGREVIKDDPLAGEFITRHRTWARHFTNLVNPDAEFINLARSGASNDSIMRETIEWLANNPDKHADTFVSIMWTEPNRYEMELRPGEYYDVITGADYNRLPEERHAKEFLNLYVANRQLNGNRAYNQMLSLEAILKNFGVKYFFCNGFNFSHFYNWHLRTQSAYIKLSTYELKSALVNDDYSLYKVCSENGFEYTTGFHFFEDGHKYFAQHIYNKLKEASCGII